MKQKLAQWLLFAQEMNRYMPVIFALITVTGILFHINTPENGGGPGGAK